jgi:hypothetical protein
MAALRPKRKNEPLALGEYLISEPIHARLTLINAIKTVFPVFFEQLRAGVYPFYQPLDPHRDSQEDRPPTLEIVLNNESPLKDALLRWARHFNAEEPWILEGALALLWHWHRYPKCGKNWTSGDFCPMAGRLGVSSPKQNGSSVFKTPAGILNFRPGQISTNKLARGSSKSSLNTSSKFVR